MGKTRQKIKQFLFKNTNAKQTVAKNTIWLFLGEILGRILKLAVIVFATRVLGVSGWGMFSYALAFVSVFYVFGDIGINAFITKEMAKGGPDKYQYLSASLFLKLILLIVSFIISLLLIPHFGTVTLDLKIVIALALLNFSDSLREFVLSINRALEQMEREAAVKVIINASITALGIVLLIAHPTPLSLALAYAAGSIIGSIISIWMVSAEFKKVTWKFPLSTVKIILDYAWPFIATTIFAVMIANVDTIMLGQMKSAAEVGYYAAAERIVQFLAIIPIFIGLATFPLMSKNDADSTASTRIFEKIMLIILAIGLPIAVGGYLFSTKIMTVLFGISYLPGGIILGILMVSVLADFPNLILSNAIFVKNLQKKFIIATALGVALNVLANIYLIPRYGAIGAAISTVASQLFIMAINWQMLKKFFSFSVIPKLSKITLGTVGMAIIILGCNALHIYFLISAIIAVIGYIALLYLLQEPMLGEASMILSRD